MSTVDQAAARLARTRAEPGPCLPREVAEVLRGALPGLADETIAAIGRLVPEYARPFEGPFGRAVRYGVETALRRFVDTLAEPGSVAERDRRTYVQLGRAEMRAGRSLDSLLAAYRVGARIAWRHFVDAGVAGGLPPETLYRLGEALFAYIDELSAESAEGYAAEQSARAGEAQRRRRTLVRLLARPGAHPDEVRAAAATAGWALPERLAALVATGIDGDRLAGRLDAGALAATVDDVAVAFVPDPDAPGRRRQLEAAVGAARGALGPSVPWMRAGRSLARARAAHALLEGGALPQGRLVVATEHLPALVLAADPELAAELVDDRLAPLAALPARTRGRLEDTLAAWLDRPGQVQAVAAELGVHPQTVRYRLRQLRDAFGARLEDPEARFELGLALRARRLAAAPGA